MQISFIQGYGSAGTFCHSVFTALAEPQWTRNDNTNDDDNGVMVTPANELTTVAAVSSGVKTWHVIKIL